MMKAQKKTYHFHQVPSESRFPTFINVPLPELQHFTDKFSLFLGDLLPTLLKRSVITLGAAAAVHLQFCVEV